MISENALYQFLLFGSWVVFGLMVALYVRSRRASMFHPITVYLAFHFITFVLRPLVAYYSKYDLIYRVYEFTPSMTEKITVLLAVNLGLVVFVLAGLAFGNARPAMRTHTDTELRQYVSPLVVTWIVTGIPGLWSLYYGLANWNTGSGMVLDMATGVTINTVYNGYFTDAQLMLAILVGMTAYIFRFRWWTFLPFVAFVLLRLATGIRGPAIAAMFYFVLVYLFHKRRRWLTATTVGLTGVAFALFRITGDDRGHALRSLIGLKTEAGGTDSMRFLESMDWSNLEMVEYLVHVIPSKTGAYDKFLSFLQVFTEPVPRVFWPGKPIGAPIKVFNLFDYGFPIGITQSLPGAGWYELGWLGIVIISVVFAWLYCRAYNWFFASSQTPFRMMFYCALLSTAIVAFRDGLVLSILRQGLFYLAPPLVLVLAKRAFDAGPSRPASVSSLRPQSNEAAAKPMTPRDRRKLRAAGGLSA